MMKAYPKYNEFLATFGIDPRFEDFLYLIPFTLQSYMLYKLNQEVTIPFFKPWTKRYLNPEGPESDLIFYNKMADNFSAVVHYFIAFVLTCYIGAKYDLLPKVYGGNLDLFADSQPYFREIPFDLKMIYMFSFGHHTDRLIVHWITERHSATYYTMLCHHIVAFGIMVFAFQLKLMCFGIPVTLLFDLSDMMVHLARVLREINISLMHAKVVFFLMMVCWLFTRITGFAHEVLWPIVDHILTTKRVYPSEMIQAGIFFLITLALLLLLNMFWFFQIVKILKTNVIGTTQRIDYEDRKSTIHVHRN